MTLICCELTRSIEETKDDRQRMQCVPEMRAVDYQALAWKFTRVRVFETSARSLPWQRNAVNAPCNMSPTLLLSKASHWPLVTT